MNNAITKELRENGVMVLTLNRPEVLNAMNKDLIMGLYEIFQEIEKENDSRVIIIMVLHLQLWTAALPGFIGTAFISICK